MKFTGVFFIILSLLPFSSKGQTENYITRYTPSAYKAGPSIKHIIKDHRDILYFATNKGILEYDGSEWRIIQAGNFSDIYYIRQAEDKTIYIGADNDLGLLSPDSTGNLYFQSLVPFAKEPLRNFNEIWQIEFQDDKVYFQTESTGFIEWDGNQIAVIPAEDTYIFNIDGILYGSNYAKNLFGRLEDGEIENIKGAEKFHAIYQTIPWSKDKHLLFSDDNGLFWLDTEKEEITEFASEASEYLKEFYFFDGIRIDPNFMALGTWEGGIIIVDNDGEILKIINKDSGLLANYVYHMVLGANHDLWVGTSDGIVQIELDSLSIPFQFKDKSSHQIIIRNITENGKNSVYNRPFHSSNQEKMDSLITLTEIPITLTFQYAVPAMAGDEIRYRSRLVGFDDDWNEWSSSHQKEYTGLSGRSNYTFEVMGKDSFGNETDVASIRVFIDIPWYQTQLKYLTVIPFLILLIFVLVKLRTRKLIKINMELEAIVKERTSDLIRNQERLEQINTELNTSNHELDSFVYHTSHDLRAPLKSIKGLVSLSKMEKFANENLELYLQMIEKSVVKLEEFITSVIEYSINAKGIINSETIDFEKMVTEVLEELKEFSNLKDIKIRKTINLENGFVNDPVRIKIIINNLVTNSVKYHDLTKDAPIIDINIRQENGSAYIDVKDNGMGIHEDYQDKVFDMFYRASDKSWGSGLGLYIIKETVNNLEGTISMNSTYGEGTTFHVVLPEM